MIVCIAYSNKPNVMITLINLMTWLGKRLNNEPIQNPSKTNANCCNFLLCEPQTWVHERNNILTHFTPILVIKDLFCEIPCDARLSWQILNQKSMTSKTTVRFSVAARARARDYDRINLLNSNWKEQNKQQKMSGRNIHLFFHWIQRKIVIERKI